TGVCVASCAAFANIAEVIDLTNIGTLFAFVLVCAGVMILRYTEPDLKRPFRTPLVPLVPLTGIVFCIFLMLRLPALTWTRFFGWLALGFVVYFAYGRFHSRVAAAARADSTAERQAGRRGGDRFGN
ncbi:MAG: amino acid permease C-terminal domain-containing protein, partial [Candidatus Binataceae bacterium]